MKNKNVVQSSLIRIAGWFALAVFLFGLPAWQFAQQGPTVPNWSVMGPHNIPRCDIPPRAAADPGNVAPCRCPGMVSNVQSSMAEDCWVNAGVMLPDTDPYLRELLMSTPTEEILECLGNVPDHCAVIANYFPQTPKLDVIRDQASKDSYICMTYCKPERCGCPDSSCARHAPGRYGQSSPGFSDQGVPNTVPDGR